MPIQTDKAILSSQGPVTGNNNFYQQSSPSLGTTVVRIDLPIIPEGRGNRVYRCKVSNLTDPADGNLLAYKMQDLPIIESGVYYPGNAPTPTYANGGTTLSGNMTATPGSASCGILVPAGMSDFVNVLATQELYVCGSDANTTYQVVAIID